MRLFHRREPTAEELVRRRLIDIEPGVPGRCPDCDEVGYLDRFDLVYLYQEQHCQDCGARWIYQFDQDRRLERVERPTPSGPVVDDRLTDVVIDLRGDRLSPGQGAVAGSMPVPSAPTADGSEEAAAGPASGEGSTA